MCRSYLNILHTTALAATIMVCCLQFSYAHDNTSYIQSFKKGIVFLDKKSPDSAISLFVKAYSEGLSKDSLFFFWTKALLQKGVLDSALATHYMVSGPHSGQFQLNLLLQRHSIYSGLGWVQDAKSVMDTIHLLPQYRRKLFIPDFEIGFVTGYNRTRQITDTASPWYTDNSFSTTQNDYSGTADIRSTWKMIRKQRTLTWGLAGKASREISEITKDVDETDSADLTGSLFGSVSGKYMSTNLSASVNRRIDDSIIIIGNVDGGHLGSSSWTPMIWLGVSINSTTNGDIQKSEAWIFTSALQSVHKSINISYSCLFNASFSQSTTYKLTLDTMHLIYAKDARLQYPVFYTDDSYSTIIDTSSLQVITGTLKNNIIASAKDTLIDVVLKQPNSSIIINPKVNLAFKGKFPVQIGLSWQFKYFPEPYKWDQMDINAQYLIYSQSDGNYYVIPYQIINDLVITYGENGGLALSPAAQQVIHHSVIRIDNTAVCNISLQLFSNRQNTVKVHTAFAKTWSTLAEQAPFNIPDWAFSASLEWRINIINRIRRQ
jgi:hypothetical protein